MGSTAYNARSREALEVVGDADWFYEGELSRLRWEWVTALREYGRCDSRAHLRRLEVARDAYVGRAKRLRIAQLPPDHPARTTTGSTQRPQQPRSSG